MRSSPMRSGFASRTGLVLIRTPNYRQQTQRRRLMVVCAIVGLALASGLIGSLTAPSPDAHLRAAPTGPFSYFPSE